MCVAIDTRITRCPSAGHNGEAITENRGTDLFTIISVRSATYKISPRHVHKFIRVLIGCYIGVCMCVDVKSYGTGSFDLKKELLQNFEQQLECGDQHLYRINIELLITGSHYPWEHTMDTSC